MVILAKKWLKSNTCCLAVLNGYRMCYLMCQWGCRFSISVVFSVANELVSSDMTVCHVPCFP